MKTFRIISLALPIVLALAACNNEELPAEGTTPDANGGEIRITATVGDFATEDGTPGTRMTVDDDAGTGRFDNGDEIGLWVRLMKTGASAEPMQTLTFSDGSWSGCTTTWNDYEVEISQATPLRFTACYPYRQVGNNYTVLPDQSKSGNYEESDLLFAMKEYAAKPQDGMVELNFVHKMACLKITLQGKAAADASVVINEVSLSYMMNSDGITPIYGGPLNGSDIIPKRVGNTFYAVIPPQNLMSGLQLAITVNGKMTKHIVKGTQGKELESGVQYPIELTLTEGGATGGITTAEELLAAMKTGGTSDNPTKITLGGDITMPKGPGNSVSGTPMTGSGYYKIDGGGHTLSWVTGSEYYLGNIRAADDATYIEITNTRLVYEDSNLAMVCIYNGKITLGEGVTVDGRYNMILANGEKATLELGDGCVLSSSGESLVSVVRNATLVLNGGTTAAGAYIELRNEGPTIPAPVVSIPKALTNDVSLILGFYMNAPEILIAEGTPDYQLTQTDFNRLKPHPTKSAISSNGGKDWLEFEGNFEFYLDEENNQIKLRKKQTP